MGLHRFDDDAWRIRGDAVLGVVNRAKFQGRFRRGARDRARRNAALARGDQRGHGDRPRARDRRTYATLFLRGIGVT